MSLAAWRAAEQALGRDTPPPLPPRLHALWRAMDALDLGDPTVVRTLAEELRADHPDISGLLAVLLGETPATDVPETVELPFRDVLSAVAVARGGVPATPTARLTLAAGYRPVLHALFRLLTDDRTDLFHNPILTAFSPRAHEVNLAARAVQITGHTARERLAPHLTDGGLHLDPRRWPTLDLPLIDGDLAVWATTRIPWTPGDDDAVSTVLSAPDAARRDALGLLLHRLARDLPLGRIVGLSGPVRAAFSLAWSLDPTSPLVVQLAALQLRVERFDPQHPGRSPALVAALWSERGRLTPDEQLHVARAALTHARDELSDTDRAEAAFLLIARSPDADEAAEITFEHAIRLPPDLLLSALARLDASLARRVQVAGLHAASAGYLPQALGAVRRLASLAPAQHVAVGQILRTVVGNLTRRPDAPIPPDALADTWASLASMRLGVWGPVLRSGTLRASLPDTTVTELADRAASLPDDLDAADLAVVMALAAELPDRHTALLLPVGRRLRQLDPAPAADLALRALSWLFAWNGAKAREVRAAVYPVEAWLLRNGGAHAAAAAERLPLTGPLPAGAVDWFLFAGQGRVDGAAFRERLAGMLAAPPDLSADLRDLALTLDLSAARGLGDAAGHLQAALQARVDTQGGPFVRL